MKTSRFSESQVALALRQVDEGVAVGEICCEMENLFPRDSEEAATIVIYFQAVIHSSAIEKAVAVSKG